MKQKQKHNRISKYLNIPISILVLSIVVTFLVPIFALAAPPPPPTPALPPNPNAVPAQYLIYKGEWKIADKDPIACNNFATKVKYYTKNDPVKYTVQFFVTVAPRGSSKISVCVLAPDISVKGQEKMIRDIPTGNIEDRVRSANLQYPLSDIRTFSQARGDVSPENNPDKGGFWSDLAGGISWLLSKIIDGITVALLGLAALAGALLSFSINSTLALNPPPVVAQGWAIVRDVMNLVFILALIVLSLATILRFENYNYKKILLKLILMALLINFSKVIAETLIAFVDVIIQFFSQNAQWSSIFSNMAAILNPTGKASDFFLSKGGFADLTRSIVTFILAAIMLISFLAIALLLVIRIVGLWVLIILSPVAYALNILPTTSQYAKQWWQTFIKYLIWAPVAIFFLRLAKVAIDSKSVLEISTAYSPTFQFIIIAALIWAAVLVAKQAGMVGSEAIIGLAEKGMKGVVALPFKGAWEGTKGLGGLIGRVYSGYIGRKAFSAVEDERKAEQAKYGLMAEREKHRLEGSEKAASLRKEAKARREEETEARAAGEIELADLFKADAEAKEAEASKFEKGLSTTLGGYDEQIADLERQEHDAAARKRRYALAQFLNPVAVMKGWHDRKEELDRRAYLPAEGFVHDMLNRYMPTEWGIWHGRGLSLRGRETEHGFMGKFKVFKEEDKAIEGIKINREYASYIRDRIARSGSVEDLFAAESLVSRQKNQDDHQNIHGRDYSPYLDLEWRSKQWARMTPQERNLLASQLMESEEDLGRTRDLVYNEETGSLVNDLSYLKDGKKFEKKKQDVITRLKFVNEVIFKPDIERIAKLKGIGEVESDSRLREIFVSHDKTTIKVNKMKRGAQSKWVQQSIEPAAVRLQTPDRGWTEYTVEGLMDLKYRPEAQLIAWLTRLHEGQERALIFGGAFQDQKTGKIRLPTKEDGEYWEAWKQVVEIRPEIASAVKAFYVDPNQVRNEFERAVEHPDAIRAELLAG